MLPSDPASKKAQIYGINYSTIHRELDKSQKHNRRDKLGNHACSRKGCPGILFMIIFNAAEAGNPSEKLKN